MSADATAPGKVIWAGEYAVLEGWPAVVAAVDRRARATVGGPTQELTPFLLAAREEIVRRFGERSAEADRAGRVVVDTSDLADDGRKLGLGSSAAATVAAVAAAVAREDRRLVHAIAHAAHGTAQAPRGSRGSGADVAASVHGGMLLVQRRSGAGDEVPLAVQRLPYPAFVTPVLVWTGLPADTPSLVARVRALADGRPALHRMCLAALGEVASSLARALTRADAPAVVAAIAAGAEALAALGDSAGVPIVPPSFAAVRDLAVAHSGAAKPTGAGGGDQILAVFASPSDAAAFAKDAEAAGMTIVPANVDPRGVELAARSQSS